MPLPGSDATSQDVLDGATVELLEIASSVDLLERNANCLGSRVSGIMVLM